MQTDPSFSPFPVIEVQLTVGADILFGGEKSVPLTVAGRTGFTGVSSATKKKRKEKACVGQKKMCFNPPVNTSSIPTPISPENYSVYLARGREEERKGLLHFEELCEEVNFSKCNLHGKLNLLAFGFLHNR